MYSYRLLKVSCSLEPLISGLQHNLSLVLCLVAHTLLSLGISHMHPPLGALWSAMWSQMLRAWPRNKVCMNQETLRIIWAENSETLSFGRVITAWFNKTFSSVWVSCSVSCSRQFSSQALVRCCYFECLKCGRNIWILKKKFMYTYLPIAGGSHPGCWRSQKDLTLAAAGIYPRHQWVACMVGTLEKGQAEALLKLNVNPLI